MMVAIHYLGKSENWISAMYFGYAAGGRQGCFEEGGGGEVISLRLI